MVPKEARTYCSIVRMAKRREGLGVHRQADLANLSHIGCRCLRARRNQAFFNVKKWSDREQGARGDQSSQNVSE